LLSLIRDAGWPIWPLILTSIFGLALIVERLLSLRRKLILPPGLTEQVLDMQRKAQDGPEALSTLERHSPLGRVFAEVMRQRHASPEAQRHAVEDIGRSVAHDLNRYIPAIGTVAMIAPLLGLFGTVVGMIEIFSSYSPTGGDPAQLARGISIALYNTAFGILIAIPAMIAHRYLRSKVDSLLDQMEQAATRLIRLNHASSANQGQS
jgi:biopolymer transport protein ExbB